MHSDSQVGTGQQETSLRKLRGLTPPTSEGKPETWKNVLQALWRKRTAEPQGTDILISAKPCMKYRHNACLARKDTVRSVPQQGHSQSLPKLGKCAHASLASPKHLLRPAGFLSLGTSFPQMAVSCLSAPLTVPFTVHSPGPSPLSRHVGSPRRFLPPTRLPGAAGNSHWTEHTEAAGDTEKRPSHHQPHVGTNAF